jgi:hypothetical protein
MARFGALNWDANSSWCRTTVYLTSARDRQHRATPDRRHDTNSRGARLRRNDYPRGSVGPTADKTQTHYPSVGGLSLNWVPGRRAVSAAAARRTAPPRSAQERECKEGDGRATGRVREQPCHVWPHEAAHVAVPGRLGGGADRSDRITRGSVNRTAGPSYFLSSSARTDLAGVRRKRER